MHVLPPRAGRDRVIARGGMCAKDAPDGGPPVAHSSCNLNYSCGRSQRSRDGATIVPAHGTVAGVRWDGWAGERQA
jgi:hypothetical protein